MNNEINAGKLQESLTRYDTFHLLNELSHFQVHCVIYPTDVKVKTNSWFSSLGGNSIWNILLCSHHRRRCNEHIFGCNRMEILIWGFNKDHAESKIEQNLMFCVCKLRKWWEILQITISELSYKNRLLDYFWN